MFPSASSVQVHCNLSPAKNARKALDLSRTGRSGTKRTPNRTEHKSISRYDISIPCFTSLCCINDRTRFKAAQFCTRLRMSEIILGIAVLMMHHGTDGVGTYATTSSMACCAWCPSNPTEPSCRALSRATHRLLMSLHCCYK